MCAKLLILESPGKVKKIQEILGSGWKVAASVGHVRDLPQKEMGVAAPDFKPTYVPTDRGKEVLAHWQAWPKARKPFIWPQTQTVRVKPSRGIWPMP